jgi:hypothetical protein
MFSRAEKAMENWTQRGLITPEGKDFLVATLDPFHDSQLQNLAGYPDIEVSPSVVRMVKQSMTISKSAALPAGDWDCQIVQWPWLKRMPFAQSTARINNAVSTWAVVQPLGGLQVIECPTAVGSFDLNLPTTISFGGLEVQDDMLQGSNRLIGMGFEAHNTTADIYKQGSCLSYMMHNVPKDASLFTQDVTIPGLVPSRSCISAAFNGTSFRGLPRTTAEALLIPGTTEWKASEGTYAVGRFAGVDNPPFTVDYNLPVLFEFDDLPSTSVAAYPNTSQIVFPQNAFINPALGGTGSQVPAWKSFPIHTSGAIFTGLSDQTSIRLNWNVIIESFPSPRDAKDLTIATPSASFDPRTLEIYSHTLGHAPVAVPVAENPLGEWFMNIAQKIGDTLGKIPGPVGMIGQGASAVAGLVKDYLTSPSGQNVVSRAQKPKNQKQKQLPAPQKRANQPLIEGPPLIPPRTFTNQQWTKLTKAQRNAARQRGGVIIRG